MSPSTAPLQPIPLDGPAVPAPAADPGHRFAAGPAGSPATAPPRRPQRRRSRGIGLAIGTLLVGAGIAGYQLIPSWNGAGAAWTSFVPWTVVLVLLLGLVALIRRAWWAVAAAAVAMTAWWVMFAPSLFATPAAAPADLTVATQNIGAGSQDQAAVARNLIATGAGLVAVQEISGPTGDAAVAVLDQAYPHSAQVGTVGLWSKWPLGEATPLELGLDWARGLSVPVAHPLGDLVAYVVHLPSVRPGDTDARDAAVDQLARLISGQPADRVLVLGDLNTATTDPTIDRLTDQLADTREATDGGFGFTWPAVLPLTRPDHVLVRGYTPVSDDVLAATGSDHRAVVAGLAVD